MKTGEGVYSTCKQVVSTIAKYQGPLTTIWVIMLVVLWSNKFTGWDHASRVAFNPGVHLVARTFVISSFFALYFCGVFGAVLRRGKDILAVVGIMCIISALFAHFWIPTNYVPVALVVIISCFVLLSLPLFYLYNTKSNSCKESS